ncbi:GPI ethanolamine phosphate transferase 1 [Frankliniella fusca]|uniref:GPI ethanolamine phosphate transferase 1 n=1 Tax=Frankliniella fusca TaxID=407009 RepID=A0AAE1H7C1_9NEOP|nr:GPI ethanolamine phosphate transferase 1 [Frankliniella fusca]
MHVQGAGECPGPLSGFNNTVNRGDADELLVPRVIHFIRMGEENRDVRPEEAACISAALRTHPGWSVVVHTDREPRGAAWDRLRGVWSAWGRLSVQSRPPPQHVFGLPFRDLAALQTGHRLRVLRKHGGMFVSSSTYLRADLSAYGRYECASLTAAEDPDVILAHRDARLLQRYLHHFHDADLDWASRPAAPRHLCRTIDDHDVAMHLKDVVDPEAAAVSHEDWYLWTKD